MLVALPHRARIAAARGRHQQRDAGIADPAGRETLELLRQAQADLVAGDDGVDAPHCNEVVGRQRRGGMRLEGIAKGLDLGREQLATGGGAMTAVADEMRGGGVKAGEQVEARDRAP